MVRADAQELSDVELIGGKVHGGVASARRMHAFGPDARHPCPTPSEDWRSLKQSRARQLIALWDVHRGRLDSAFEEVPKTSSILWGSGG